MASTIEYGPFYRLQDSALNAQMAATSKACGRPMRNIAQSDIPRVKAYRGHLPNGKTGLEFTTTVKPTLAGGHIVHWDEGSPGVIKEGDDLVCIPITILRQADYAPTKP